MKTRQRQLKTKFGREARFEAPVAPAAAARGEAEAELDGLKGRLLRDLLNQSAEPALSAPLRRAANEAASLAWITPFPLLFFPTLLEEKALTAQQQTERQRKIRQKTMTLLDEANSDTELAE